MVRSTSYTNKEIRSSAVLTNSYVAGTILGAEASHPTPVHENTQAIILLGLTIGNLTTAQLKVEFSHDGTTYYQETASAVSGSTSTDTVIEHSFAATGNYRIPVSILDRFIKISVKGTGDATNSLTSVVCNLGIN